MPHSSEDKKRAITRLRRIKGQADALERAIEAGADCAPLLQQIVAMRGATNGLMAEVMESHLRETFGAGADRAVGGAGGDLDDGVEGVMKILRNFRLIFLPVFSRTWKPAPAAVSSLRSSSGHLLHTGREYDKILPASMRMSTNLR